MKNSRASTSDGRKPADNRSVVRHGGKKAGRFGGRMKKKPKPNSDQFEKGLRHGLRMAAQWVDTKADMHVQGYVREHFEELADSIRKVARTRERADAR